MKLIFVINEFESSFASSFKHTAYVKYEVEFKTSVVDDILENLYKLKEKFEIGDAKSIKVGWEMTLEHIDLLIKLLKEITTEYRRVFSAHPGKLKIYDVNRKLREVETPSIQDFARGVISELFIPDDNEKLSKAERLRKEAEAMNKSWAMSELKKQKRSK